MWGEWVSDWAVDEILKMVGEMPHCTFLTLTKNPDRYAEVASRSWGVSSNLWCGASAVDQMAFSKAAHALKHLHGNVPNKTFVSLEPLHGPISLKQGWWIDWVIVGREGGPSPAPCKPEWVAKIAEDARKYETPLFMKDSLKEMCEENNIPFKRDLPYLDGGER
jgi:protein gp37